MSAAEIIKHLLLDAEVIGVEYPRLTVRTGATAKQVFDAELELRRLTREKWELMMPDMQDRNVIRLKRAKKEAR